MPAQPLQLHFAQSAALQFRFTLPFTSLSSTLFSFFLCLCVFQFFFSSSHLVSYFSAINFILPRNSIYGVTKQTYRPPLPSLRMADFDFTSRLETLKSLGVNVEYGEHVREEELNETAKINSEDEFPAVVAPQSGGKDASQYDAGRDTWNSVAHSLPEKKAPVAKIDDSPPVMPLDCSKFIVGEPADETISFCSWKVILAYPDSFIGKANRPRVCA